MASMFPMSAIQMRMKRNCEASMSVAVVVIYAALQCAMVVSGRIPEVLGGRHP
jgi:hypothetical protein